MSNWLPSPVIRTEKHFCPKCGSEMEVTDSWKDSEGDRFVCEMCGFIGPRALGCGHEEKVK